MTTTAATKTTTALVDLPPELMLIVLSGLATFDVMAVGGVCKRLYGTAGVVLEWRIRGTQGKEFGVQICPPSEKVCFPGCIFHRV